MKQVNNGAACYGCRQLDTARLSNACRESALGRRANAFGDPPPPCDEVAASPPLFDDAAAPTFGSTPMSGDVSGVALTALPPCAAQAAAGMLALIDGVLTAAGARMYWSSRPPRLQGVWGRSGRRDIPA